MAALIIDKVFFRWLFLSMAAWVIGSTGLWAAEIGLVLAVKGRAVVVRDGQQIGLRPRSRIETDDVVATAAEATVQLVFNDRTRMVVGPSSQLDLTDVRIGGSGRASSFVVEAVSGTFRFLSGDSAQQAYQVKTPTATMGIRGTVFDFAVRGRRPTSLVTLQGEVEMCGRRGRCARVIGGCAVAVALPRRIEVPADRRARDALLLGNHPFVLSQSGLRPEFRAPVESCGEVSRRITPGRPDSIPTRSPDRRETRASEEPARDDPEPREFVSQEETASRSGQGNERVSGTSQEEQSFSREEFNETDRGTSEREDNRDGDGDRESNDDRDEGGGDSESSSGGNGGDNGDEGREGENEEEQNRDGGEG